MSIQFNINNTKAVQVLLWILKKKPDIDMYNVLKVVTESEIYHLNTYGRPVYGDRYEAWEKGTVPQFMYGLVKTTLNMPFYYSTKYGLTATASPDMDLLSESDIEALEHGMCEYGDLCFEAVKNKNHKKEAWKKYEDRILAGEKRIQIPYEDLIDSDELRIHLEELADSMVI